MFYLFGMVLNIKKSLENINRIKFSYKENFYKDIMVYLNEKGFIFVCTKLQMYKIHKNLSAKII